MLLVFVYGTTTIMDTYALYGIGNHVLQRKKLRQHSIVIAPCLAMLGMTFLAFMLQGIVCFVNGL